VNFVDGGCFYIEQDRRVQKTNIGWGMTFFRDKNQVGFLDCLCPAYGTEFSVSGVLNRHMWDRVMKNVGLLVCITGYGG